MLTTIDTRVKFRALVPLESRKAKVVYQALDVILRFYNDGGFTITDIHCDQEFRSMMEVVSDDLDVRMNYMTTGEHVPEAERSNRTIKERIRANYQGLPFRALPVSVIKHLAMHSVRCLNYFPNKHGISKYFSPYTILSKLHVDAKKQLKFPFGAYVQACQDNTPTNTIAARTIDCVYLGPAQNKQGGHVLLDISTGRVITRPHATELPTTALVIQAVERLAKNDGMTALKFTTRNGTPFEAADWIEGGGDSDSDDSDEEWDPV